MSKKQEFVIVGAGLAGATAAQTLREEGFEGGITLIGEEAEPPYLRPPLSKEFLAGKAGREEVFVQPADWYGQASIELRTDSAVVAVGAGDHRVSLANGDELSYDKLLLATGSTARRLPIEGAELDGVRYLRTLADSEALHELLSAGGKRLVVIGAGWIGMEVGATARELGNEVTLLDRDPVPLAAALGERLGQVFAQLHTDHGVVLRTSVSIARIVGDSGKATAVELEGGEFVPADIVLMGVGAAPNVELAAGAGLETGNGVLVDATMRTSAPDIFAAGDIANAMHPVLGQRLRSEHWANAIGGGAAAARAMLGQNGEYADIPYFYTDQFDLGMEYSGYAPLTRDAEVVVRGDLGSREFIAFWLAQGRVVAGMNVNIWDVNEQVQAIIRSAKTVDAARLADADVPLEELA